MKINLQGKNLELTEAIKDYILKKVASLEKVLAGIEKDSGDAKVNFEVVKTTNHHKAGEIFHASCRININGKEYFGQSDHEDLYSSIDEIKETMFNEIRKDKDRGQTLYKRGASSIKKMMKGLSKRNPFTSKY